MGTPGEAGGRGMKDMLEAAGRGGAETSGDCARGLTAFEQPGSAQWPCDKEFTEVGGSMFGWCAMRAVQGVMETCIRSLDEVAITKFCICLASLNAVAVVAT